MHDEKGANGGHRTLSYVTTEGRWWLVNTALTSTCQACTESDRSSLITKRTRQDALAAGVYHTAAPEIATCIRRHSSVQVPAAVWDGRTLFSAHFVRLLAHLKNSYFRFTMYRKTRFTARPEACTVTPQSIFCRVRHQENSSPQAPHKSLGTPPPFLGMTTPSTSYIARPAAEPREHRADEEPRLMIRAPTATSTACGDHGEF